MMETNTKRTGIIALFTVYISFSLYQNPSYLYGLTKSMSAQRSKGKDRIPHKLLAGKSKSKSVGYYSSESEPYFNRWKQRFSSPQSNITLTGKYLFFKHIRKAGGTTLRSYFNDVFAYYGRTRNKQDFDLSKTESKTDLSDDVIYYVEQEFSTMDYNCPIVDPRWNNSLRIITLRHPIERHLSEFFFSGPGHHFPILRDHLYVNQTYTKELSEFVKENVPAWMEKNGGGKGMEGKFNMLFGRFYVDNFQLRALAGCSSRECLDEKNFTNDNFLLQDILNFHPSVKSYAIPVPKCTNFITMQRTAGLLEMCSKMQRDECSNGCDGPCFYPSVAWGKISTTDIERATKALEAYDVVLLMETFDEEDQSAWLSDVMGVPRDSNFALNKKHSTNSMVEKSNIREKTHFYRDLFRSIAPTVLKQLELDNELEVFFFNKVLEINKQKTDQWKKEVMFKSTQA